MLLLNLFYVVLIHEGQNARRDSLQNENGAARTRSRRGVHQQARVALGDTRKNGGNVSIKDYHSKTYTAEETVRKAQEYINSNTRELELKDVFISVKTTKKFHENRLQLLLDTWYMFARDVTYFFSDADDSEYKQKTRGHMVNTNCSSVHTRRALCCKMSVEYDHFMASGKRWFCHVDDDTYVNVAGLLRMLKGYNHTQDWYLGKPSLNHPLEINDIENSHQKVAFWFATGGAGFCLSRGLALKMMPFTGGGKLKTVCEKIRLPDDCTIGFIVYYYLKKELTVIAGFHSHLEGLWRIGHVNLDSHITFGYSQSGEQWNVVHVPGFDITSDPTRFRSIHCLLYPNTPGCPSQIR
jgi:hypothetical protein